MLNFCEKREKKVQKNSKVKMTKLSKICAGVPQALPIGNSLVLLEILVKEHPIGKNHLFGSSGCGVAF